MLESPMLGSPVLESADVRVADCRWYLDDPAGGRRNYLEGHIPGAVFVSLDEHLSAPPGAGRHPLPSPEEFLGTMGSLGIGPNTAVVAYDDRGGAIAARLWWMLGDLGHERVAVLDGGLRSWLEAGLPLDREVKHPDPVAYPTNREFTAFDRDRVRRELADLTLLDARAASRFRGEEEPIDPVAGHIPGARNVPYEGNLAPDDRLLSPEELRTRYTAAGVTDASSAVVYCGSGVTACHDILAMEVAGLGRAALYSGSWSDWAAAGYPTASGPGAAG